MGWTSAAEAAIDLAHFTARLEAAPFQNSLQSGFFTAREVVLFRGGDTHD
jgi:hypothetical protein